MLESLKLINPEFDFQFSGVTYKVRKATLDKIILFQAKFEEVRKAADPAGEYKLAVFCLYLILKDATPSISEITEEWVASQTTDVSWLDVVEHFGFLSRQKVELLRQATLLTQRNAPAQTGESSTQS